MRVGVLPKQQSNISFYGDISALVFLFNLDNCQSEDDTCLLHLNKQEHFVTSFQKFIHDEDNQ